MKNTVFAILHLLIITLSSQSLAQDSSAELANKISTLKEQVVQLNRDLFILQEALLFPAETQVAVFLSVDSGVFFRLDAIELRLNDKTVSHYLYTEHEQLALSRGGVQRLWVSNIKQGPHELVAFAKGKAADGRFIEQAAAIEFEKTDDEAAMLEIQLIDSRKDLRGHIQIKQWQQ